MLSIEFGEYLKEISGDDVKVAVALAYRASLNPPQRLTLPELARLSGLGTKTTQSSLFNLKEIGFIAFVGDVGPKEDITIHDRLSNQLDTKTIAFSWKNTDDKRLTDMEQWLRSLAKSKYLSGEHSNLFAQLQGDAKALVGEIEQDYGRPLNTMEAYTLGRLTREFDCGRIKTAWRKAGGRNRILSVAGMMKRRAVGSGAKIEESKPNEIKYRRL